MKRITDRLPVRYAPEVEAALAEGKPVLALESTVITHGLPFPQNLETARELEKTARDKGAVPATLAVLDGVIQIGLKERDLDRLSELSLQSRTHAHVLQKLARRDLPLAVAHKLSGGTTVSATLQLAHLAGIQVFATGGIGGVHRLWQQSLDISADLSALKDHPVIVVTAGCKAILDLPATLEQLETLSVPVYGWQTGLCPAFYTRETEYKIERIEHTDTLAAVWQAQLELHANSGRKGCSPGLAVMNPIPAEFDIPAAVINPRIEQALREADQTGIRGKAVTPFLLQRLAEITEGKSVRANLALLRNNVTLGSRIARALAGKH